MINIEKICDRYLEEFCANMKENFIHVDKSILPSELFIVYCLNKHFQIETTIESGMAYGCSTRALASMMKDVKIKTVDNADLYGIETYLTVRKELSRFSNLDIFLGDGTVLVPSLSNRHSKDTQSILLDGPKNATAAKLINEVMVNKNIKFAAVHDQGIHGANHCLESFNPNKQCIYSDEELFQKYDFINDLKIKNKKPLLPSHMTLRERMIQVRKDRKLGGEGYPGIGFVIND